MIKLDLWRLAGVFVAALLILTSSAFAQTGGWEAPASANYTITSGDLNKTLSSSNAPGASMTVTLPSSFANGWGMGFSTGNGHGVIVNAPVGTYIYAGGKTMTSFAAPSNTNSEYFALNSDGVNFYLVSSTQATAQFNGIVGAAGGNVWRFIYATGYAATLPDNGSNLTSRWSGGPLTITLPSTTLIPNGWSIGLYSDGGNPITIQPNGVSGGTIVGPAGVAVAAYTVPQGTVGVAANFALLSFDGGAFRVLSPSITQTTYSSNAALKAALPGVATTVYRAGFYAAGDGGAATYTWSPSACTLNAGAGDNGGQVAPNAGTGCWVASFSPSNRPNPKIWGAYCDNNAMVGAHDDGVAIRALFGWDDSVGGTLIDWPSADCGMALGETPIVKLAALKIAGAGGPGVGGGMGPFARSQFVGASMLTFTDAPSVDQIQLLESEQPTIKDMAIRCVPACTGGAMISFQGAITRVTGSVSTVAGVSTLTVTNVLSGPPLRADQSETLSDAVKNTVVTLPSFISALGTGTGGVGTYILSSSPSISGAVSSQTLALNQSAYTRTPQIDHVEFINAWDAIRYDYSSFANITDSVAMDFGHCGILTALKTEPGYPNNSSDYGGKNFTNMLLWDLNVTTALAGYCHYVGALPNLGGINALGADWGIYLLWGYDGAFGQNCIQISGCHSEELNIPGGIMAQSNLGEIGVFQYQASFTGVVADSASCGGHEALTVTGWNSGPLPYGAKIWPNMTIGDTTGVVSGTTGASTQVISQFSGITGENGVYCLNWVNGTIAVSSEPMTAGISDVAELVINGVNFSIQCFNPGAPCNPKYGDIFVGNGTPDSADHRWLRLLNVSATFNDCYDASNAPAQASFAGYISNGAGLAGTILTITSVPVGPVNPSALIRAVGVLPGTVVVQQTAPYVWTVNNSQLLGSAGSPVAMTTAQNAMITVFDGNAVNIVNNAATQNNRIANGPCLNAMTAGNGFIWTAGTGYAGTTGVNQVNLANNNWIDNFGPKYVSNAPTALINDDTEKDYGSSSRLLSDGSWNGGAYIGFDRWLTRTGDNIVGISGWTTIETLVPSSTVGLTVSGTVRATFSGHTASVSQGSDTNVWNYKYTAGSPSVTAMTSSICAGSLGGGLGCPQFQLAHDGSNIFLQVKSYDGTSVIDGGGIEVTLEEAAPIGVPSYFYWTRYCGTGLFPCAN